MSMHRREFLERTAAAGALAAGLPAASWARVGGSGESIRIGIVGCGPHGQELLKVFARHTSDLNLSIHRVCDVYRPHLNVASGIGVVPDERATFDYREVLDDHDIDAVVVATPDHWHAKIATEAMEAGKAVFVETPLCHTIEQALAIRETTRRTKSVLAVGVRRCSDDRYWQIRDDVVHSRIGKVTWSQGGFCVNPRLPLLSPPYSGTASLSPAEDNYLWWDQWLGHKWGLAPEVEYSADRFFHYRKFYDYSGGMASEFLFAVLAPLLLAARGPEGEEPARVVCGGGRYTIFDSREIPDQMIAVVDFPSEHSIMLAASSTTDTGIEIQVRGRHATATVGEHDVVVQEQAAFYPEFRSANKDRVDAGMSQDRRGRWIPDPPKGEVSYTLSPGERSDCYRNFIHSIRGEETPHCGVDLGFSTMISIKLIVEALRRQQVLRWDAAAGKIVDA
ncbi:MAG: Gfo/Idh/MocA family oxidoreductase [Phycisphaerales bacterium]|nr:Gfo/Idh/MocA family oxidoreductase [Phycisphaerales bacterium]